ncbi:formyltransferase [Oxalobacteraceae bacterium CAVE-383]|nr:formyltransferase [Oxalobacteraceae bacterium CAVE-383]
MKAVAVVFAYHDVGVRCLKVLLARGVHVALVVTHEDNPSENIFFESVAAVCAENAIPSITPEQADTPELLAQVAAIAPDFIFSFYYRNMLPAALLSLARRGAYNMHGSLLPKYRGRVPINWAVLHGETETGATLHEMTVKPDAGAIAGRSAVPILPDDTAYEVFRKVTVAAEQTLWNALPPLLDGSIAMQPNDLSKGSYFGRRVAADGLIDWQQGAQQIHNLVRAVAPPYPGAFWQVGDDKITVLKTRMPAETTQAALQRNAETAQTPAKPTVFSDGRLYLRCGDGRYLQLLDVRINDQDASLQQVFLKYSAA